jgi:hypothetical protein
MTSITIQDRITASYQAAQWRRETHWSRRELGDLLLLATQVEGFPHNYTDKVVRVAEQAIRAIAKGNEDECVENLLTLDDIRYGVKVV